MAPTHEVAVYNQTGTATPALLLVCIYIYALAPCPVFFLVCFFATAVDSSLFSLDSISLLPAAVQSVSAEPLGIDMEDSAAARQNYVKRTKKRCCRTTSHPHPEVCGSAKNVDIQTLQPVKRPKNGVVGCTSFPLLYPSGMTS